MCGITGILNLDEPRPIDRDVLADMNRVITHRGPDADGFHEEAGRVGLAMRRLEIIDREGGRQPMANEDGTIHLVFNGEIYNFQELRQDLETRGHTFRTRSDTEVIVHAYEEHGDECVTLLRGMFTFALWDARRQRLLLARDRAGIKQLYYTIVDGQLLWGSELKCLLMHPAVERRLNAAAVNQSLTFLYVPAPLTIFENVCKDYEIELPSDLLTHLFDDYYAAKDIDLARYHPKFIVDQIKSICDYEGVPLVLERERVDVALANLYDHVAMGLADVD